MFREAAAEYVAGRGRSELVKVYEKLRQGIWVYNGLFGLVDWSKEASGGRTVFKFRLELLDEQPVPNDVEPREISHTRLIPSAVKMEVWKRDHGQCVKCGSKDNLHFDHDQPFSKGGTSLLVDNIRVLCARHNLEKRDRIE